jgi:hypothetical protein
MLVAASLTLALILGLDQCLMDIGLVETNNAELEML